MDDRLREVRQQDLSESKVNEEFVDWLKTKGPQYLLLVLIAVCGYLAVLRWQQHKSERFNEAWAAYLSSGLPGAFEDVAAQYGSIPGLPQQALRSAADTLLGAVQSGRPLGAAGDDADQELTDEQRAEYLDRADRLYRAVLDSDDESLSMTLFAVSAYQGLAVVAESRGDAEQSAHFFEMAAKRADRWYPELAARVRGKASTAAANVEPVVLPAQDSLPQGAAAVERQPIATDPALSNLLPGG